MVNDVTISQPLYLQRSCRMVWKAYVTTVPVCLVALPPVPTCRIPANGKVIPVREKRTGTLSPWVSTWFRPWAYSGWYSPYKRYTFHAPRSSMGPQRMVLPLIPLQFSISIAPVGTFTVFFPLVHLQSLSPVAWVRILPGSFPYFLIFLFLVQYPWVGC